MAFDGETKSNCSHVASHVDVALSHVDVALSRQEMVEWLATELTDELTCENLKERTVLMRLNALRRYIGLCISGTGKLSLSQVFSNADMMRSFLLAEPISSRSHSISALLKVNSILQQQAGRQCPNYDKLEKPGKLQSVSTARLLLLQRMSRLDLQLNVPSSTRLVLPTSSCSPVFEIKFHACICWEELLLATNMKCAYTPRQEMQLRCCQS